MENQIEKQFRVFQSTRKRIDESYWYICQIEGTEYYYIEINIEDGMYISKIDGVEFESPDLEEVENFLFEAFIQD